MQPIIVNRPQNIDVRYEPLPNTGYYAAILRVVTAVAEFFRLICLRFVANEPRFNDRVLEPLVVEEVQGLPRRVAAAAEAVMPIQERDTVATLARQIITPDMEEYSKRAIIEAINAIPAEERAEVVRNTVLLITPRTYDFNRINIIRIVARIPVNERNLVTTLALQVITLEMEDYSKRAIIEAITAIPAHERAEVVRNAALLITPQMYPFQRTYMIETVARLPMNETAAVVALARQVITPEMEGYSKRSIIEAITAIPAHERAEVVRNAALLITPQMYPFQRTYMIRTIAHLPTNERDAVAALALQVITPGMDEHSRKMIIEAIFAIPDRERADVIQHALQLITPQMYAHDRIIIIRNMANNIPANQRANYVQQRRLGQQGVPVWPAAANGLAGFMQLINPQHRQQQPVINARAAAAHGVNVHEGDRDHRLKAAIQLFYRHQGQISSNAIHQAVQEFTQYLNNRPMNAEHKRLAQRALFEPKAQNEAFGPLIRESNFTILGHEVSGKELIGRLWIFTSGLTEPDQTNAKDAMISALKNSYETDTRICDQGKTQRLVVAVLQGRLAGVNIELREDMQVSAAQAVEMFFHVEAHRNIEQLTPLIAAANRFCNENPAVNREDFIREIREYARAQDFRD